MDPKFDKSNNDNTYTRNKIRNELIPYIQNNINPNIIQTLSRLSELVIEEEKFMEKTILKNYTNIMINEDLLKGEIILDLRKFNELERVIKSRIILLAVQKIFGNTKHIEKKHIEDIIKLCCNNIGNKYLMPNKSTKIRASVYFASKFALGIFSISLSGANNFSIAASEPRFTYISRSLISTISL